MIRRRILLPLLLATPLSAQAPDPAVVRGRAVDPAGAPVAGVTVELHQVGPAGGTRLGVDTTAADGVFVFPLARLTDDAVVFAAARHEGILYLAEPFRPPLLEGTDYLLPIGSEAAAHPTAGDGPGGAAPPGGMAAGRDVARLRAGFWLVVLGVGSVGALALALAGHRRAGRPRAWRAALLELAALEERAAGLEAGSPEHQAFEARRRALREQLRGLAGTAGHVPG